MLQLRSSNLSSSSFFQYADKTTSGERSLTHLLQVELLFRTTALRRYVYHYSFYDVSGTCRVASYVQVPLQGPLKRPVRSGSYPAGTSDRAAN